MYVPSSKNGVAVALPLQYEPVKVGRSATTPTPATSHRAQARPAAGIASAWATSTPTISEMNMAKRTGRRWSKTGRCAKATQGSTMFGW